MRTLLHPLVLVVALSGAGMPAVTGAQTPLPAVPPKQSVQWLDRLVVDPRLVARDGMQSVTAAVRLRQRAAMPMKIDLELVGGTPVRGNPAMQRVECVWTYRSIYLSQRAILESVPIYTGSLGSGSGSGAGAPSATVPTTITIVARYGSERLSTSFTVNCPQ